MGTSHITAPKADSIVYNISYRMGWMLMARAILVHKYGWSNKDADYAEDLYNTYCLDADFFVEDGTPPDPYIVIEADSEYWEK